MSEPRPDALEDASLRNLWHSQLGILGTLERIAKAVGAQNDGSVSRAAVLKIADSWDAAAEKETDAPAGRRETLRECADLLRLVAGQSHG
jgi:hypothetical protein